MRRRHIFFTEFAYIAGILLLALATAFLQKANFGMSMVVAPAYILHLKISEYLPFFTFGMAEYCFQGLLIVLLSVIMRKFSVGYLFSFITAVLYGTVLDACVLLVGYLPLGGIVGRIAFFISGMLICCLGVAFLFHTYIPSEVYELFVIELTERTRAPLALVKTLYDCSSCFLAVVLSFACFGMWHYEGIGWGTIICAVCNGFIIGKMGKALERLFSFKDALPLRRVFSPSPFTNDILYLA